MAAIALALDETSCKSVLKLAVGCCTKQYSGRFVIERMDTSKTHSYTGLFPHAAVLLRGELSHKLVIKPADFRGAVGDVELV